MTTAAQLAEKLETLLALRDKAALATTIPFQPADASWSIAEYCGEEEDLVANSMSFNVAKFFSEVSNQSPDLLREAAALLRSQAERVAKLEEALIHIAEYWNGSRTDGAMADALDEIVSTARAALHDAGAETKSESEEGKRLMRCASLQARNPNGRGGKLLSPGSIRQFTSASPRSDTTAFAAGRASNSGSLPASGLNQERSIPRPANSCRTNGSAPRSMASGRTRSWSGRGCNLSQRMNGNG